jgi:2-dehydropantoate 2-reductase
MRVAVVGAGGVGGYFGGRLAEAGEDVVFLARGATLEALRSRGLRVDSAAGGFTLKVRAVASAEEAGPADVVLVAVKAWQVGEAAHAIRPLVGPDTMVVPLQNGVEALDQLAAVLDERAVVGGLCRIFAMQAAPGHVVHAGVDPSIDFGEPDGRRSERVERLRAAFARAKGVTVSVPFDIREALWAKFLFIAPFSGVGGATRMSAGVIRSVPEARELLLQAMREVRDVARAQGAALPDEVFDRTFGFFEKLPADATSSMQRDIIEGRPSELEAQTGAVVRLGRAAAVPTPVNGFLYAALLPAERQARGTLPS